MANWRENINLNGVIDEMSKKYDLSNSEDPCPDEVKESLIAEIMKSETLQLYAGRIRRCKSIASVNRVLQSVFDDADRYLVWCGA